MHHDHTPLRATTRSRRAFLRDATALLGAAAVGAGAQGQTAPAYKALVAAIKIIGQHLDAVGHVVCADDVAGALFGQFQQRRVFG